MAADMVAMTLGATVAGLPFSVTSRAVGFLDRFEIADCDGGIKVQERILVGSFGIKFMTMRAILQHRL